MMRAELSQPAELAPGYAQITITEPPPLDAGTAMFSIEQPPRGFLQAYGETPWGTTHAWLRPFAVSEDAEGLGLTLGPDQTWNLKPNVTYVLRVRAAGTPEPILLRMAWKGIRMPSQAPPLLPEIAKLQAKKDPVVEAKLPDETVVLEPAKRQETVKVVVPDPAPKLKRLVLWIVLALVLLAAAGGAAWYFMQHKATPSPELPKAAEGPLGAASARVYLQKNPDAGATFTEAQRYEKQGSPDAMQGALVLLNRAAAAGNAPAETAIGRMYDPDGFSPQTSAMKAPDPDKSLLWYQRAAQGNDADGLYRLGKLLMSGRAAAPGQGPEQGVADLQRASQLGSKPAQEELDKLHAKQP